MIKFLFFCLVVLWVNKKTWETVLKIIVVLSLLNFIFPFVLSKNFLFINKVGWFMLVLVVFLWPLVFLNFTKIKQRLERTFLITLFFMLGGLLLFFLSSNLIGFYIFFEFSALPVLFLILGWGYQVERLQARRYLIIYIILTSLPILVILLLFYKRERSINFESRKELKENLLFQLLLLLPFLVKLPIYFFHLWLPKAHVEAPVIGRIILAGILLKMGGYGIFRLSSLLRLNCCWFYICLVGLLLRRCVSFIQRDLKSIIAMSSVVHITIVAMALFLGVIIGLTRLLVIMFSHGLISSAIFRIIDYKYFSSKRRLFYYLMGNNLLVFGLLLVRFFLLSMNFSVPPRASWVGEVLASVGFSFWNIRLWVGFGVCLLLACYINIYLFVTSIHGKENIVVGVNFNSSNLVILLLFLVLYILIVPVLSLFL